MMSVHLYDVCLSMSVTCIMSSYLYSIISAHWMMSAYLHDACSPVLCLLICTLSAILYDVCLTVLTLPISVMSAYIMSSYLCYDCSTEWRLPTCMMPAYL
jgi:hypothetical protein